MLFSPVTDNPDTIKAIEIFSSLDVTSRKKQATHKHTQSLVLRASDA